MKYMYFKYITFLLGTCSIDYVKIQPNAGIFYIEFSGVYLFLNNASHCDLEKSL